MPVCCVFPECTGRPAGTWSKTSLRSKKLNYVMGSSQPHRLTKVLCLRWESSSMKMSKAALSSTPKCHMCFIKPHLGSMSFLGPNSGSRFVCGLAMPKHPESFHAGDLHPELDEGQPTRKNRTNRDRDRDSVDRHGIRGTEAEADTFLDTKADTFETNRGKHRTVQGKIKVAACFGELSILTHAPVQMGVSQNSGPLCWFSFWLPFRYQPQRGSTTLRNAKSKEHAKPPVPVVVRPGPVRVQLECEVPRGVARRCFFVFLFEGLLKKKVVGYVFCWLRVFWLVFGRFCFGFKGESHSLNSWTLVTLVWTM